MKIFKNPFTRLFYRGAKKEKWQAVPLSDGVIKPCPFCGDTYKVIEGEQDGIKHKDGCWIKANSFEITYLHDDEITLWNKRAL